MTYSVTASFSGEQAKIEGSYPISMFAVNASPAGHDPLYYVNLNQDVYGFQVNSNGSLTATEVVYTGLPIDAEPVETNIKGEVPEVSLSVPNVDRAIESFIQTKDYLRGCEVYSVETFAKYLPASNLDYRYLGETPDKNSAIVEKLYVDSTTSDENVVTFSCKPKFILKNIVLPGRRFDRICDWNFSATGNCNASSTQVASWVTCDKTLHDCELRHNSRRFGAFPSIPRRGIVIV